MNTSTKAINVEYRAEAIFSSAVKAVGNSFSHEDNYYFFRDGEWRCEVTTHTMGSCHCGACSAYVNSFGQVAYDGNEEWQKKPFANFDENETRAYSSQIDVKVYLKVLFNLNFLSRFYPKGLR